VIAGSGAGSADGEGTRARFNVPAGIAATARGELIVADAGNAILRRIGPVSSSRPVAPLAWLAGGSIGLSAAPPAVAVTPPSIERGYPLLTAEVLRLPLLPWPLDPQEGWHEVAGTLGEPRGSRAGDGRERFHAGLDVRGEEGLVVRSVRDEKVSAPLGSSGFGSLSETLSVGAMSYVHVRVGRDRRNVSLDPERFIFVDGANPRVRVRRGTRFAVGDPIGTVNRFYHVHLEVGLKGMEVNALTLPLVNFVDYLAPTIVPGGIRFFSEHGEPLQLQEKGRIHLSGRVAIVVDAFDQVEGNVERRKLGLFEVGYQVLAADGTPAPGFETPVITLRFDRLPPDPQAPWIAYAAGSGITTYGNRTTRFLYIVTNLLRDGRAEQAYWDTALLPPGDYTVRITARDVWGNEATENTDVAVTVAR
jgi:hypothetical protein